MLHFPSGGEVDQWKQRLEEPHGEACDGGACCLNVC